MKRRLDLMTVINLALVFAAFGGSLVLAHGRLIQIYDPSALVAALVSSTFGVMIGISVEDLKTRS